jgi:hypothetical protein
VSGERPEQGQDTAACRGCGLAIALWSLVTGGEDL